MANIFDEKNPNEFFDILPVNIDEKNVVDLPFAKQNDHVIFKRNIEYYNNLNLVRKLGNFRND